MAPKSLGRGTAFYANLSISGSACVRHGWHGDADPIATWWSHLRVGVRRLNVLGLLAECECVPRSGSSTGAHVQREAVAAIRRANGEVEYNLNPNRSPWWLRWLADRLGIDYVSHVTLVILVGVGPDGPSTGAELDHIAHLKQIEQLELWESSINDARLADIGGLTRLRTLCLHKTRVGDKGLANLKGLPALRVLWLN